MINIGKRLLNYAIWLLNYIFYFLCNLGILWKIIL